MKFRFSKAVLVKVIAFTALSGVFTMALGVKIGNLRLFSHTYELQAEFTDASGIFKGDSVKLAGVDVGRVKGSAIENGMAVVTFTVDDAVKLPNDTVVGLRWRNVLGQRFLYVYPSDRGPPFLKDGDRIPASQTQDAGDLGEFLNKLGPILQAIDPDKANAFLDAVNSALAGNEAAVQQLIGDGGTLAADLGAKDEDIKTLIETTDTVLSTYADQNEQIEAILDDLDHLGGVLKGDLTDIDSFVTEFTDVQEQLDRLLEQNRGSIDADLSDLDVIARVLKNNRQDLENTLCTLPAGLAGYFQTTSWGEWFNVRVTQVVLKDSSGNEVPGTPISETSLQTDPQAQKPYTKCAGSASNSAVSGRPSKPATGGSASGEPAPAPAPPPPPARDDGFQDLGTFLDFVLGEGGRG